MHKRAILLDIDGTLVDSNDAHVDAWQRAFAAEGHSFSRSEIHEQIGKGGDNLVPSLLPDADATTIARLSHAESEIYKSEFLKRVEPFDGARDVLRRLAARGHTLVLASSASREEVDHYVQLLDADGLLSGTTSKDDVESSKPCPDIFEGALALTGAAASNAVVIGDTPYDIEAARRTGLGTIALLSGGFAAEKLSAFKPLAIYPHVLDLEQDYDRSPLSVPISGN